MSVTSLIGTGIALGCVHVLTGPDHLSALATLAANNDELTAFWLGTRWGIGHSTGLIIVSVVLIALSKHSSGDDDTLSIPDDVTKVFQSVVGVFMLLLGLYGLIMAFRKRQQARRNEEQPLTNPRPPVDRSDKGKAAEGAAASMSLADVGNLEAGRGKPILPVSALDRSQSDDGSIEAEVAQFKTTLSYANEKNTPEVQFPPPTGIRGFFVRVTSRISAKVMAILVGIVHGIAGPGGVLGVLPAVQMQHWIYSTLYLGAFCFSSTLVMGFFAATYGSVSSYIGKGAVGEFRVACFSAFLSVVVGILWIVLVYLDKLDSVFPE